MYIVSIRLSYDCISEYKTDEKNIINLIKQKLFIRCKDLSCIKDYISKINNSYYHPIHIFSDGTILIGKGNISNYNKNVINKSQMINKNNITIIIKKIKK